MESINDKEKKFKSVVENLEFEINTDQIWENVSPHLDNKRGRRKPFLLIFLSILGAMMCGVIMTYVIMQDSNDNDITAVQNITENNAYKSDDPIVSSTLTPSDSDSPSNSEKLNEPNDIKCSILADDSYTTTNYEAMSQRFESNTELINENDFQNNNISSGYDSGGDAKINTRLLDQIEETSLFQNKSSTFSDELSSDLTFNLDKENDLRVLTYAKAISPVENLKTTTALLNIDKRENNYQLPSTFNFIEVYNPVSNIWKPILSLRTGINKSISKSSLSDGNADFNVDLFGNETGLYGMINDLNFGYENSKGLKIFGVVSYYNQNSSFRKSTVDVNTEIIPGTGEHINTDGFVETVSVDLERTTTTYNDINWHRRHKYVDIGLGVGKTLVRWKALSFGMESMLLYNIVNQHSGYYFAENSNQIIQFNDNDAHPYISNSGLSFRVSASFEYRYKAMGVQLLPFINIRQKSILGSESFYKTNDNLIGLQLSINVRPF